MKQNIYLCFLLVMFVAVSIVFVRAGGCQSSSDSGSAIQGDANAATVSFLLTIDFGDDKKSLSWPMNCPPETTVLEVMQRAQQAGILELASSGGGEMAFLSAIDGIKSEGGSGKNWVFYVNGELAKRGCGTVVVQSFDEIDWRFEVFSGE
jgi:hypothetical protein